MHRNRITAEAESIRLPRAPQAPVQPQSFFWYPVSWLPGNGAARGSALEELYRLAFEQAQAVARPSLPERDLLAVWN